MKMKKENILEIFSNYISLSRELNIKTNFSYLKIVEYEKEYLSKLENIIKDGKYNKEEILDLLSGLLVLQVANYNKIYERKSVLKQAKKMSFIYRFPLEKNNDFLLNDRYNIKLEKQFKILDEDEKQNKILNYIDFYKNLISNNKWRFEVIIINENLDKETKINLKMKKNVHWLKQFNYLLKYKNIFLWLFYYLDICSFEELIKYANNKILKDIYNLDNNQNLELFWKITNQMDI